MSNLGATRPISAKVFIFNNQFDGFPKETDLKLVEEELPPLQNGGKYVVGEFGWRTHTISTGEKLPNGFPGARLLPDFGDLPLSLALGTLGMPGNTAYFGLLELCHPKPSETVIVTGAGGAVGNVVGQIAKIKGCNVIGVVGSEEKGKWLVEELGFDNFINYKKDNIKEKIKEYAPNGIDCYFDNVGGEISNAIMFSMNQFGRVAVCGAISAYNEKTVPTAPIAQYPILSGQLRVEGFVVHRWLDRWLEGIKQNKIWILEGKLKHPETVTEGFENMFKAFIDMFNGVNFGKAVVKV